MDNPICFSHNFVNKQNVRSVKQILSLKVINKRSVEEFLLCLLENELVSEITSEIKEILITLKTNVVNNSKKDFKQYLIKNKDHKVTSNTNQALVPVNKEDIFIGCWSALYDTIPLKLYGNQHNIKIFKDMVRLVLFSMKNQHIFLSKCTHNWDYHMNPWRSLLIDKASRVLNKVLCWILKNILSAIICLNFFVTTCKIDTYENRLHFFWKNQWQSFYDKTISEMIISNVISKCESKCLGQKVKSKYSPQERLELKVAKKEIPKLHLVLKSNNNYRPIVRYKADTLNSVSKYKIKDRLNFLRILAGEPQAKMDVMFASFHSGWVSLERPKLYFVKTDLSNAFGSINREKLRKILTEMNIDLQKTQQRQYLKKKFAQMYRETVIELRKPIIVRAGSTVYEWKEGLVQGYKYSPALSELYYKYMDQIYFSDHLKANDTQLKLFVRVVDDYLYVTNSLEDAQMFLKSLSNYSNVNYEKTIVNFPHSKIKYSDEIPFLGYSYNTKTLQVNRANDVFTGPMCYKITFSSAISNVSTFLENRIGQSGIQINSHLFNFNYNSEEVIWMHVFLTLCLSANKFCTILGILCNGTDMYKYLDLYKKRVTVKLCNAIIDTLAKTKPKDFQFVYCINHFRYLSFKALNLCAKKTPKCNRLVPFIDIELRKTNCIFGKFKEHASRIDIQGKSLRSAIIEVCRRTDLRKIMKQFEILPNGFECYNHRMFYTSKEA